MLTLGLGPQQMDRFEDALKDSERRIKSEARLLNKFEQPMATPLHVMDGEVVIDTASGKSQPSRTAHLTLLDPKRLLEPHVRSTSESKMWFNKMMQIFWCIDVDGDWIKVPVFTGWVQIISRYGIEVELDGAGKEVQHIEPYTFPARYTRKKGERYGHAIKQIFLDRGEKEKNFNGFGEDAVPRRLPRSRTWGITKSPWRSGKNMAEDIDRQLYYRGNGVLMLRKRPTSPQWVFDGGDSSIIAERPRETISMANIFNLWIIRGERQVKAMIRTRTELLERYTGGTTIRVRSTKDFEDGRTIEVGEGNNKVTRKITNVADNRTVTLSSGLGQNYRQGAEVNVRYMGKKTKRVVGKAKIEDSHPFSAKTLTDGKRPIVKVEDKPQIHRKKRAQEKAEESMRRTKLGIEDDIGLVVHPVPHLEELDPIKAKGTVDRLITIKRMTIPLGGGLSEINWKGERVPYRSRKHRKKIRKRKGYRSRKATNWPRH